MILEDFSYEAGTLEVHIHTSVDSLCHKVSVTLRISREV